MLPWKYPGVLARIVYPQASFRADPSGQRVYLTYDDGPNPEVTPQLLDTLNGQGASASFFVLHRGDPWWGELLLRIAAEGHQIGLHGISHRSWYWRTNKSLGTELNELRRKITELGIQPLDAIRPPYGQIRPDTVPYLLRRGFCTVLWSSIPGDFRPWPTEILMARALKDLRPGCIVVLHDGTSWRPAPVLELTRQLLGVINERGWQAAALDARSLNNSVELSI